jgi:hypothetical protein
MTLTRLAVRFEQIVRRPVYRGFFSKSGRPCE